MLESHFCTYQTFRGINNLKISQRKVNLILLEIPSVPIIMTLLEAIQIIRDTQGGYEIHRGSISPTFFARVFCTNAFFLVTFN